MQVEVWSETLKKTDQSEDLVADVRKFINTGLLAHGTMCGWDKVD